MRIPTALASFLIVLECVAQDGIFSQFLANKLYLNPSFVGSNMAASDFTMNSRQQWSNVPGPTNTPILGAYRFNQASFQSYCSAQGLGFGLQLRHSSEGEGVLNGYNATLYLGQTQSIWERKTARSYKGGFLGFKLQRVQASAGLAMGMVQRTIDWSALRFSSQYHPYLGYFRPNSNLQPQNDRSNLYFDPSFGVRLKAMYGDKTNSKTTTLSTGFAVFHLIRPVESFFGLNHTIPRRYNGFLTLNYFKTPRRHKNNPLFSSISLVYDHQAPLSTSTITLGQQLHQQLMVSAGVRRRNFWDINAQSDAVIFAVNALAGETQLGVSYDLTVSALSQVRTTGSLELSLTIPLSNSYCLPGISSRGRRRDFNCVDSELMRIRPKDFINFLP
jgi:type IX secretion system PorP/SprF family membrane protein